MPSDNPTAGGMEIRSFHLVFRLERRLHRIDRWRLPFPHGVPIAAIGHATVVVLAVIVCGRLPAVGALIGALPAPVAYVLIPGGCASLLARLRIDGRPAHRHLLARMTAVTRQRMVANRPALQRVHHVTEPTLLAHGPERGEYPHGAVVGPATVRLFRPARARARARTLTLTAEPGAPLQRPRVLRLGAGQRFVLRGTR